MNEEYSDHYYVKRCSSREEFERELFIYNLKMPYTPKLIAVKEPDTIVLERVEGRPYLDLKSKWNAKLLAETISEFHYASLDYDTVMCHHDNQPGNILYDGKRFYLVDFSDTCRNRAEHDITHLMLFWAEEFREDIFEKKCDVFLREYQENLLLSAEWWKKHLKLNIARFDKRRKEFNKLPPKNILRTNYNRKMLKEMHDWMYMD